MRDLRLCSRSSRCDPHRDRQERPSCPFAPPKGAASLGHRHRTVPRCSTRRSVLCERRRLGCRDGVGGRRDAGDDREPSETEAEPTETTGPAETDESEPTEGGLWTATEPNMDPVDDATAAQWQQLTEEALAASVGTPGVLIAVSHPELGFWSAAIGDAEVDADPMTLDHHSRIGSVTKTMTAVAILQLVEAGSLSLDDTVADVVPDVADEFPPTADITVEHLLSMTSGLPDYANLPGRRHRTSGPGPDQGLDARGTHRRRTRCCRRPADRNARLLDDELHDPRT